MKAAIYARFSDKEKQTDKSIDDQFALCRAFCAREGHIVVGTYSDHGISGASTINRMGLQRLLRDARAKKFDVIIAESLDRVSRDLEDLAGFHKRIKFAGVQIITAQDNIVADDLQVGVKGLFASLFLKDLAHKTRRGQAGVVRDGRHNGGRSYGYRPIPGQAGELEIEQTEAAVVRQIFADYLNARSPRDIAAALNSDGVRGPRGGVWNASTIAGSRKRQNGILQNELYAGRILWNRQTFIKDPETGRRISRENPRDQWMAAEAEHLRIIDAETWARVQARRAERGGSKGTYATRPKHLLSGLIKCGCCGSGYVVGGSDKRGSVLFCSRMKETGLCDNRRSVPREAIETLVLNGIEEQLASPELIAEYVREYQRMSRELNSSTAHRRRDLEKRLGNINGAISKAVDALLGEAPSRALRDRLTSLEAQRDEIEAAIAEVIPPAVEFHPNAANAYRDQIRNLKKALAESDEDSRLAAHEAIREIVEKVVLHPQGRYKPVRIDIYGQLAALLRISERAAEPLESRGALVAGIGFEPMTFRL